MLVNSQRNPWTSSRCLGSVSAPSACSPRVGTRTPRSPIGHACGDRLRRTQVRSLRTCLHQPSFRPAQPVEIPVYSADGVRDRRRGAPRILCYGDSNTAGFYQGGRRFQPYGQALAEAMSSLGTASEVAVCGLSSFTTRDMLNEKTSARIKVPAGPTGKGIARILAEDGPFAAVLIMTGTNDAGIGDSLETIVENTAQLHAICHELGIPTVAIAATTSAGDIGRRVQKKLAQSLRQWAESAPKVLACLDVEEMVPRVDGNGFWEADGLHLSAAGSNELGRRLAPEVSVFLKQLDQNQTKPAGSPLILPRACSPPAVSRTCTPFARTCSSGANSPSTPQLRQISVPVEVVPITDRRSSCSLPITDRHAELVRLQDKDSGEQNRYKAGDEVEVWSNSKKAWCPGKVCYVLAGQVSTTFMLPDGAAAKKDLSWDHKDLRKKAGCSRWSLVRESLKINALSQKR